MRKLLLALALLFPATAWAQQYPSHSMLIGAGAGTTGFRILGPCSAGQVPTWTGGPTVDPSCSSPPGTGTVLSVGLTLPSSVFTVTGSPITSTGTITGSFVNQAANSILAGPTSGSAALPVFRTLVGADLPIPTSTTLGGVQGVAPVAHQWINSIVGGVPGLSQPTFADINGVAAPTQLPLPTTTTLGGVLSNSSITSNWVNAIGLNGQPILSQPTFNDIAGSLGVGQISSLPPFSLPANATNIAAVPTSVSLSAFLDAAFGNAEGDLLLRGATAWTVLAPGAQAGQVLETGGAGALPTWATVSGTGTMTSMTCGTGLSGGTFSTSGTCAIATAADATLLSNISGSTAVPIANTLTATIDHDIGSVQGNILYRGGSVWATLAPGTSGQFLQTQGAAANPRWTAAPFINFLSGLTLSNDTVSPNTVLDIATGAAFDSTNASVIQLAAAFTKSTGGSWASGSGANGMGNGLTIAASTWYHVCLANNSGNTDVWFDTSAVCANRPTGITDTKFRRIGSFHTDASSHILGFIQYGDNFWETATTELSSGGTRTFALLSLTGVPLGVVVQPQLISFINQANQSSNCNMTIGPGGLNTQYDINNLGGGDTLTVVPFAGPPTNTSAQIYVGVGCSVGSIQTVQLQTVGYIDTRGK